MAGIGAGDISVLYGGTVWEDVPETMTDDSWLQTRNFMFFMFYVIWSFLYMNIFIGLITAAFDAHREEQATKPPSTRTTHPSAWCARSRRTTLTATLPEDSYSTPR
mmetsp:Transcript_43285/g.82578  ORF Transcript_43285/g.82578 Transcript_43285/m.82578 type:complete len:106 (-) Transcript_43285:492-809(-)